MLQYIARYLMEEFKERRVKKQVAILQINRIKTEVVFVPFIKEQFND